MDHIKHRLLKKGTIQSRLYQEAIIGKAAASNTLAVLPTGLGKTPIAIVLSVLRLEKFPDSRVMILAPTKPLIEQHLKSFRETIDLPEEDFVLLTGQVSPEDRGYYYSNRKLIFATPQTVRNDLEKERLRLDDFSLIVFDEAHHAVGDYAYPFIAKKYQETAKAPRILGLTASPGGTRDKIKEICENIGIESVEIRTENDPDVMPYVKRKDVEWIEVDLPKKFLDIKSYFDKAYRDRLNKLRKVGLKKPVRFVSKKDLLALQQELMKQHGYRKFYGVSLVSQAIKVEHAINLLETQGMVPLEHYLEKLQKDTSKAGKNVREDSSVKHGAFLVSELSRQGISHPKMGKLLKIVNDQLRSKDDSKIIVFANFRNTVKEIVNKLSSVDKALPVEFMGQKEGLTQKEQKKRIEDFKAGAYNVLVTTSVGEEGIDIPEMSLAIFYEPVPSEIRQLQRRGRVGRTQVGKIIILMTKGTRDEAYYWTAHKKEKIMRETLYEMKSDIEPETDELPTEEDMYNKKGQRKLGDF